MNSTAQNVTPRTGRETMPPAPQGAPSTLPRPGVSPTLGWIGNVMVAITCLLGNAPTPCLAQDSGPDYGKGASETMRLVQQDGTTTMIGWLPHELWRAGVEKSNRSTASQKQAAIQLLERYFVVMVCRYETGPFGGYTFASEREIRDHLAIIDRDGVRYHPLDYNSVPADFQNLLGFLKPMMENNMGRLGKNLDFYVFPAKSRSGQVFGKASVAGLLNIEVVGASFSWRLPLGSLLAAKTCSRCGEKLSGAFSYCPYDATALPEPAPDGTLSAGAQLQAVK
jgi:hypothetical protein